VLDGPTGPGVLRGRLFIAAQRGDAEITALFISRTCSVYLMGAPQVFPVLDPARPRGGRHAQNRAAWLTQTCCFVTWTQLRQHLRRPAGTACQGRRVSAPATATASLPAAPSTRLRHASRHPTPFTLTRSMHLPPSSTGRLPSTPRCYSSRQTSHRNITLRRRRWSPQRCRRSPSLLRRRSW
jgi:hypothetical protein